MDENARADDRYCRTACIIAYKSRGARRPLPFPTIPYSPSSGPSPPSSPFPCVSAALASLVRRVESPLLRRPSSWRHNKQPRLLVSRRSRYCYVRTYKYAYTCRHSMPRPSHGIFARKEIYSSTRKTEKEETRASLHDFVSRCACMETKVRRGTLSGRGMEKE